jgi:hypothetical protein
MILINLYIIFCQVGHPAFSSTPIPPDTHVSLTPEFPTFAVCAAIFIILFVLFVLSAAAYEKFILRPKGKQLDSNFKIVPFKP